MAQAFLRSLRCLDSLGSAQKFLSPFVPFASFVRFASSSFRFQFGTILALFQGKGSGGKR